MSKREALTGSVVKGLMKP